MGKKKAHVNRRKMKRLHGGDDEWRRVNRTFKTEIEPIVNAIRNPRLTARVRESLGNYLIIRLVSMTDYYFSNRISRMIDEGKLDASNVMDKKSLEEELKKGQYTAGAFVGTNFNYSNKKFQIRWLLPPPPSLSNNNCIKYYTLFAYFISQLATTANLTLRRNHSKVVEPK